MNSIPKAKITKRKLAEPAFKKAPRITGLDDASSKGRFVQYVLRKYNRAEGY